MQDRESYVDVESALARVRGNKSLFVRMLGMFLKGGEYDALLEEFAAGEMEKAGNTAHAIKGIAGNLSLTKLFDCASVLTERLRQGVADAGEVEAFKEIYQATKEHVEAIINEG